MIIAQDVNPEYTECLVYKQLCLLETKWKGALKIFPIIPPQKQNIFEFFFLIKIKQSAAEKVADKLNMKLFNRKKGYSMQFLKEERLNFEPLRNFHKHKVLLHILNEEFSVNNFVKKRLIKKHFPLHSFPDLEQIKEFWQKEKYTTIFDGLKMQASSKDLRPYNAIAFYYGCDVAFYLSFNCILSSWLIFIALIGIGFYTASFFISFTESEDEEQNNFLTPIYVILVSFWVTITLEKWKRREFELSFVWETKDSEYNKIERPEYTGNYIIDNISKTVREEDSMNINVRIALMTIPLLIVGVGLLIANFVLFVFLSDNYSKNDKYSTVEKLIYTALVGALNGTIIFIFQMIYNFFCEAAVKWENHRFEDSRETSIILKTFVFDFLLAYMNLFFYGFVRKDFPLLASTFTSIVITKNLLFNLKMNIVPWLLFKFKRFMFKKKWRIQRKKIKEMILKDLNIDWEKFRQMNPKIAFESLSKETQKAFLYAEKELLIQEQVHYSYIMSPLPNMRLVWTNYAIQFGYIAFFSLTFPLAPLIGFLMNIFDLYFSYFALTNHLQRKPSVEKSSIGIWNNIFSIMSYMAVIVNLGLMVINPNGLIWLVHLFGVKNATELSSLHIFITIVVVEHLIFALKYLIDVSISDKPSWIRKQIQKRKNLAYRDEEKMKRKFVKIKSEKKYRKSIVGIKQSLFSKINELRLA